MIDGMMIIGKYFESNIDYINVMKLTKNFKQLVLMYHFNPISDWHLFENIETQCIYKEEDKENINQGISRYVYWYPIDYEKYKRRNSNEEFKRIVFNCIIESGRKRYPIPFEDDRCNIPEGVTSIGNGCFSSCTS